MAAQAEEKMKENNSGMEFTLEEGFRELEKVLQDMEEEVSLEESFRLYHRGIDLLKECSDKIDHVEKQIQVLDEEGEGHGF